MKKYYLALWFSGIILFLILISPFISYVVKFYGQPISGSPADWGTFGDFVGGTLNSVMGVVNIFVLLYLTFKIASIEGERNDQALALQERLALNEIKLDAYKEVNSFFLVLSKKMMYDLNFGNHEYHQYKVEFHTIVSPYVDLFKCFEPDRLNAIGEVIFNTTNFSILIKNAPESDIETLKSSLRINYISQYTSLLNDMRQELHL